MTPGQRESAQEALDRRQRDENIDQAMANRQDNVGQAFDRRDENLDDVLDHRGDIADDILDHREEIWDDIYAPGWAWTVGAAVAALPSLYQPVVYEDTTYYYCDGHYLEPVYYGDDVSYMVTAPAPGTVVCGPLPADTQAYDVNGRTVYFYADVYYEPYPQGGVDCFVVVEGT